MRIDRSRFLALTAAIAAASACNAGMSPPASPSSAADRPPPLPKEMTPSDPASLFRTPDEVNPATGLDDTIGDPATQSACDRENSYGSPGDCDSLRPAVGRPCDLGEGFGEIKDACNLLKDSLSPRMAERAVGCLLAKSGSPAICSETVVSECVTRAFKSNCTDSSSLDPCRGVLSECAAHPPATGEGLTRVTLSECRGAVAAVPAESRSKMIACMTEGCTAGDCYRFVGN
jgi:hypothetical protein